MREYKKMLKYTGNVNVRLEEENHYEVKVTIEGYEERTEANLRISKESLTQLGIKTLKQAQVHLPKEKEFILGEIDRTYPSFWEIE